MFQSRYRLSPTQIRKQNAKEAVDESLRCELSYRPPFDWQALLGFLAPRAAVCVEKVIGNRYMRTVAIGKCRGWIEVEPVADKNRVRVDVSPSLLSSLLPILTRVKRLLDLTADPVSIASQLGPLAEVCPGLRVPGAFDGFEIAVRAILGQQVSVKAATTLAGRFNAAFGEPSADIHESVSGFLSHYTPGPERIAAASVDELVGIGILASRARSIIALAHAVASGEIVLEPSADVDLTLAKLKELPGIGEWTAQYIAMRALSWPDAFPHTDLGVFKALGDTNPRRILSAAEGWRPWRSYAAMHLWRSLEAK